MTLTKVLFNQSEDKRVLYNAYLDYDVWNLLEASFIANGHVPIPNFSSQDEIFEKYPIETSLRTRAIEACLAHKLKSEKLGNNFYVRPKDFLEWASRNWALPEELTEVVKLKEGFKLPKPIREHTRNHHEKQVRETGKQIAERLGYFNQKHIYDDDEMAKLLEGFVDDIGNHHSYSEGTIKSWLSEDDPRPKTNRRGRPKGPKKE